MKPAFYLATLFGFALLPMSAEDGKWIELLDPNLSQWELWMGVPHTSVKGLPEGTLQSNDYNKGTPLGLANDPKKVFSVIEEDGKPVLKITGKTYGEWTTAEFYVLGQQAIHLVNGHVVLSLDKARLKDGTPLVNGKIQIQSEDSEVYYQKIRLCSITTFPAKLLSDSKLTPRP